MKNVIKKGVLTGLGVAFVTHRKFDELLTDFAKRNNLSKGECERLAKDLIKHSKSTVDDVVKELNSHVSKVLGSKEFSVSVSFGKANKKHDGKHSGKSKKNKKNKKF